MSSELQSAYSVSAPPAGLDGHILIILAIMVVAGILGGIANCFLADREGGPSARDWIKYPVFGVVAALTVPLFLNMISSTLLEGARTRPLDFYVFGGFCLIYVVASRRLFENVVHRLLGRIDQVHRDVVQIRQQQEEPPVERLEIEAAAKAANEAAQREALTYNDVEILRALSEDSYVYGNLAAICDSTGLARDLVGQRLSVLKAAGVIETRINDKNVLHWVVSARGKNVLLEIMHGQEQRKTA